MVLSSTHVRLVVFFLVCVACASDRVCTNSFDAPFAAHSAGMADEQVLLSDDGVKIYGFLRRASPRSESLRDVAVVLLHPFAKLGGGCHDHVVMALSEALAAAGSCCATLRVAFRGAAPSGGSSTWFGTAEREDVRSAVQWLVRNDVARRVVVVGYSFGACVSGAIVDDTAEVIAYVGVSYPYGWWASWLFSHHYPLAATSKPQLFVCGSQDEFTSAPSLQSFVQSLSSPAEVEIVSGANHVWANRQHKAAMTSRVAEWVAATAESLGGAVHDEVAASTAAGERGASSVDASSSERDSRM